MAMQLAWGAHAHMQCAVRVGITGLHVVQAHGIVHCFSNQQGHNAAVRACQPGYAVWSVAWSKFL
jgi:hypothetical protein